MTVWPFMALTDSDDATVAKVERWLANADAAVAAHRKTGIPLHFLCGIMDHESLGGQNIYGHDIGGVFTLPWGQNKQVTEANYREFYQRVVVNKERSNGVGPMQITYRGYHVEMKQQGLKGWVAADTVLYGARIWLDLMNLAKRRGKGDVIRWAATYYNAGSDETKLVQPYSDNINASVNLWRGRLNG